jgi:1,4-alpha-glucan branching enzyme
MVRRMFISSAVSLITEFHIDGLRVDLTQAIHRDHVIHANGYHCPEACRFGTAFLREWVRALRLLKPGVLLLAEDHTGWDSVITPQANGGIGFDATWWSEWYHHLIGDATNDSSKVRLIRTAGLGDNQPLRMDWMSEVIRGAYHKIIYHESHDEAGNSSYQENGQRFSSARTMMVSVNGYLFENTRRYAEARSRVAVALTMLSPGTPMFFMAEEVGATKPYRFHDFLEYREDIESMKRGSGANMFHFYQDLIGLRRNRPSIRSSNIEIIHVHNENRILAFLRSTESEELLVVVSLNNFSFNNGYWLRHDLLSGKKWKEILNSDYSIYGGETAHTDHMLAAEGNGVNPLIPSNSILVLQRI